MMSASNPPQTVAASSIVMLRVEQPRSAATASAIDRFENFARDAVVERAWRTRFQRGEERRHDETLTFGRDLGCEHRRVGTSGGGQRVGETSVEVASDGVNSVVTQLLLGV